MRKDVPMFNHKEEGFVVVILEDNHYLSSLSYHLDDIASQVNPTL